MIALLLKKLSSGKAMAIALGIAMLVGSVSGYKVASWRYQAKQAAQERAYQAGLVIFRQEQADALALITEVTREREVKLLGDLDDLAGQNTDLLRGIHNAKLTIEPQVGNAGSHTAFNWAEFVWLYNAAGEIRGDTDDAAADADGGNATGPG